MLIFFFLIFFSLSQKHLLVVLAALGSFVEEYNNKVQIVSLDEDTSEFSAKSTFDHPYPTTKIMWIPDTKGMFPDLLATSGDYLRIWRAGEPETRLECLLNNNKNSDFCAPLTSFDWNEVDPNLLGELADTKEVSRPSFE